MEYQESFRVTDDMLASKNQRFCNYIVDFIAQILLYVVIGVVIGLLARLTGDYSMIEWLNQTNRLEDYLFGIIVTLMYYMPFEIFLSRTVGKYITNTMVVMADGSKPDSAAIIKRSLSRLIPFNVLSFLGERGWHDSISDTYVVQKPVFDEKMSLFHSFNEIGIDQE